MITCITSWANITLSSSNSFSNNKIISRVFPSGVTSRQPGGDHTPDKGEESEYHEDQVLDLHVDPSYLLHDVPEHGGLPGPQEKDRQAEEDMNTTVSAITSVNSMATVYSEK